jgi:hypothetical protein
MLGSRPAAGFFKTDRSRVGQRPMVAPNCFQMAATRPVAAGVAMLERETGVVVPGTKSHVEFAYPSARKPDSALARIDGGSDK